MKAKYIITILVIALSFVSATTFPTQTITTTEHSKESRVYVCGGKYATKFHSHAKCRGLNNCKGGIYYYNSIKEAERAGYTYCRICWK